ncbi:DNA adenine methylase [candidate division KSB1 bacterium]|nr:DNA adenine methylase [candidate division KSB1 bacterium]
MAERARLVKVPYSNLKGYIESKKIPLIRETGVAYRTSNQLELLEKTPKFPSTRFQGSKLKITEWIWDNIKHLNFSSVLDAFGGTGCVSHYFKSKDKQVTYNDILKFNYFIGLALIENDKVTLSRKDVDYLLQRHPGISYPSFIYDTFHDIYYTDEESQWLDVVVTNIDSLDNRYKKAMAYFALFQACIIKRPYNLFHRKNLYIRFSDVERNFGNKTTWDTPFEVHFKKFVEEANNAVFSNGYKNKALNKDVFGIMNEYDLVYIDTPYISNKGVGVDYFEFYHFLEGLLNYSNWDKLIDHRSKHRKLKHQKSIWTDKSKIHDAFGRLFNKFQHSILVVSYRSDGIPSIEDLVNLLGKYKRDIVEVNKTDYKYVLSNNKAAKEVLLVGI